MKILLKNGNVVNVFTEEIVKADVLIEDSRIMGVGDYADYPVNEVIDLTGKYVIPGLIDGHVHIESTMLTPYEMAKLCLPHGTTAVVADPHEIANVCGVQGVEYMLQASENLPMQVYINLPSCVPATRFDESGAVLTAEKLRPLYAYSRVVGLAEMMNYPGVLFGDQDVHQKLKDARALNKPIDGHAPFLTGRDLDAYIAQGVQTDHECSNIEEAKEKLSKGQWIMVRQGTAARNLSALLPLFDPPYCYRAVLVTDDRHPADLIAEGHIDNVLRLAVRGGKAPVRAIRMATLQVAECFRIPFVGAVAPGYSADIVVLEDLTDFKVTDVFSKGNHVVKNGKLVDFAPPKVEDALQNKVRSSFHVKTFTAEDFIVKKKGENCRVIGVLPGELITEERVLPVDFSKENGVDISRDILKIAVIERHNGTGHIGLGYVQGMGLKTGAIATSVSHDSHNIIAVGASAEDLAFAVNRVAKNGGNVVVKSGEVLAEMPLPIAGLMSEKEGERVAEENAKVRAAVHELGVPASLEPFMNTAFLSLSVIPSLKMTTLGLVRVETQELVPLFVNEK
ncbi:MAG: adenine deaminase [Clostridiales bacterium]|nr:adenine deaminase [Clostridiales bacterium]